MLFFYLTFCFLVLVIVFYLVFLLKLLLQRMVSVYLCSLAFLPCLVLLICLTLLEIILVRFSKFFINCFINFIVKSSHNTPNSIITKWNSCLVCLPTTILASFWCKEVCYYYKKRFLNKIYLLDHIKYMSLSFYNHYLLFFALSLYLVDVLPIKLRLRMDLI